MSKISFVLRANKSGKVGISVKHTHKAHVDKVPFQVATGVVVERENFDAATGRVRSEAPTAADDNTKIQAVYTDIERALALCKQDAVEPFKKNMEAAYARVLDFYQQQKLAQTQLAKTSVALTKNLTTQLDEAVQKVSDLTVRVGIQNTIRGITKTEKLFTTHIDIFIKKNKSTLQGKSIANYENVKSAVELWNKNLHIDEVTVETLESFRDYLLNEKVMRHKNSDNGLIRGMRNGSAREVIQKFKIVYYAFADKFGYDDSKIRRWKHGIKKMQNKAVIYLKSSELEALTLAKCATIREELHRDFYVLMANTGLRFVDARRVNTSHIKNGNLVIMQQKTSHEVTIPLTADALNVLEKWRYNFSDVEYTAQVGYFMNQILKRNNIACYNITRNHFKKNKAHEEIRPKRELISSHTARKTFINVALTNKMKITSIKNIVGHTELNMIMDVYGDGELDTQEMGKAFTMPVAAPAPRKVYNYPNPAIQTIALTKKPTRINMEPQELLDWLDANQVADVCGLEEEYCSIHFFGTSCCVQVDEEVFAEIVAAAEMAERQQRQGKIRVGYPIAKLYDVVLNYLRLRKMKLLLED